jgi:hypothetical protein
MRMFGWQLRSRKTDRRSSTKRRESFRRPKSFQLETLEDRRVMTSTYTVNLVNQTGLDPSQYAIYALGFSTASQVELKSDGTFGSYASSSGKIHSYRVGTGSGQLSQITFSDDTQLKGAIVYFFVTPLPITDAPYLTYSASGSSVVQPTNPPNNTLPGTQGSFVYQFMEITEPKNGLPTIDLSTVDGFTIPINVTLDSGLSLGQPVYGSGQNPVVNRAAIFTEYTNFLSSISSQPLRDAYGDLLTSTGSVANQPLAILNPGIYLAAGANSTSLLNTTFDSTLTTLFETPANLIGMIGDDGDYYQGTPTQLVTGEWVISFVGYKDKACTDPNGNTYNIYSPLTPDPLGSYQANETSGEMVFANDGVFADMSTNVIGGTSPAYVALGLQRDIVQALNRGVALLAPTDGINGDASNYWGTESNWYPAGQTYNYFSWFMHTGQVSGTNIFLPPQATTGTAPPVPVTDAQGKVMGQAYGFGYDESPDHPAVPAPYTNWPNVASKFDPVPASTSVITVTLTPWTGTTPPPVNNTQFAVVGSGKGEISQVKVYEESDGQQLDLVKTLKPFGKFKGGVNVATGDLNGDGVDDIIVGAAQGGKTNVMVYDGATFAQMFHFYAFPESGAKDKRIGVSVAAADVNNDGHADIVVGAQAGWLPLVRVFDGTNGTQLHQFLAFTHDYRHGVNVAAGDINKDGFSEIVVGSGAGSLVKVFNGNTYDQMYSFNPFKTINNRRGVYVAIGDVQGSDDLEIIAGTGGGVGAEVRVFDAMNGDYVDQVFEDRDMKVAIPVGVYDWNQDGTDEVISGRGRGWRGVVTLSEYNATTHRWLDQDHLTAFDNKDGESIG